MQKEIIIGVVLLTIVAIVFHKSKTLIAFVVHVLSKCGLQVDAMDIQLGFCSMKRN